MLLWPIGLLLWGLAFLLQGARLTLGQTHKDTCSALGELSHGNMQVMEAVWELEKPMGMAIASWPARVLGCDLEAGEFSGAAILLLA